MNRMVTILICLQPYCCFPQPAPVISWYFSYEQVSKGKFLSLDCIFVDTVPCQSGPWSITISLGPALPLLKTYLPGTICSSHVVSSMDFTLWIVVLKDCFFPFLFYFRSWLLTILVLVHRILLKFDWNHPIP